jgi:hypothetical protein
LEEVAVELTNDERAHVDDALQEAHKKIDSALINDLRQLRLDARRLNSSIVHRLKDFRKPEDGSFKTSPDSKPSLPKEGDPPNVTDISVGSTCTVLMAAIGSGTENKLFKDTNVTELFIKTVETSRWASSGLPDGNAFTTAVLVRCAGVIVAADIIKKETVLKLTHAEFKRKEDIGNPSTKEVSNKTLEEIIKTKSSNVKSAFAVEDYPAKTAHAYWFVDGVIGMGIELDLSAWETIASWASSEFHKQVIYVSAENDSLMDPPMLAMAACVINRIRRMTDEDSHLADVGRRLHSRLAGIGRPLPSVVELEFGIKQVFSKQSESGIWHKYFPLFHFPEGKGAADYCFSFEFLEAILVEFGLAVLRDRALLEKMNKVIRWCDTHELAFVDSPTVTYRGWNAGGDVGKLEARKPESWATATVHMFLTQLDRKISDLLDELILKKFGFDRRAIAKSPETFDDLIDSDLTFPDTGQKNLKEVVKAEIIDKLMERKTEDITKFGLPVPRSALLFGPPGTSKSRLAKAIAEYLGWPLVVITPSEFLGKGLEQVHAQVNERFHDLLDLQRAVVFFDEMDALAQTREGDDLDSNSPKLAERIVHFVEKLQRGGRGGPLDVTRQLLTTSMLPKLSSLWDQKQVLFLMATNHRQQLDPAITRPSRFDLLLCVPPPSWARKSSPESLVKILSIPQKSKLVKGIKISKEQASEISKELERLVPAGSDTEARLDVFTVAETGIFLDYLYRKTGEVSLLEALKKLTDISKFREDVEAWTKASITLRTGSKILAEFQDDRNGSRRQYYPGQK